MSKYETLVTLECRQMVDAFVETARGHMERDGEVLPVVLVAKFGGEAIIVGGLHKLPKSMTPKLAQKAARQIDADFALFVSECWIKSMDYKSHAEAEQDYERIMRDGDEVRTMPGRIDAVMFQLETYVGQFGAHVSREGEEGKYTFGKPEFNLIGVSMGRFTGMLPPKGNKQ